MMTSLRDVIVFSTLAGLMPPGVSRLPVVSSAPPAIGGLLLVFCLVGPVYDFVRYRLVHPVYIWGGLLAQLTIPPVLMPLASSGAWHDAATG